MFYERWFLSAPVTKIVMKLDYQNRFTFTSYKCHINVILVIGVISFNAPKGEHAPLLIPGATVTCAPINTWLGVFFLPGQILSHEQLFQHDLLPI